MIPDETIGETALQRWVTDGGELPRILLVDDDIPTQKILYKLLEDEGFSVLAAASGMEALDICRQSRHPISLLLTDVTMPGMSGFELAERAVELQPLMRVLFMSGDGDGGSPHLAALRSGHMFLAKPFDRAALMRTIKVASGC